MTKLPQPRRLAVALWAIGLTTWAAPSMADMQYKFSGFGTLGAVKTTTDDTEFRQSIQQYSGAGKKFDLGVDSRLAAQGSAIFSNGVTLTAQVLGARLGDEDFNMGFEWLYAQYTGIEGLDLKAGRVVLPAFLVSDSRLVGYALPWVRVPTLVYAMMPLSHVDGEQATYRHAIGSAIATVQFTGGRATTLVRGTQTIGPVGAETLGDAKASGIVGLNASLEWGDWTFRVSQIKDKTELTQSFTYPAFVPFVGGTQRTDSLPFHDKFQEIGLQYDDGKIVVMAEQVKRSTKDEKVQVAKSWYLAGGYRFGPVMPYVLTSQYTESFIIAPGTPAPKAKGDAVGVRYDFATNLALKAEFAQFKNNSLYVFTDSSTPGVADKRIKVMSVTLDFIF